MLKQVQWIHASSEHQQIVPHNGLRKWKIFLSYLPWFRLRNLWKSTVKKKKKSASVMCHLRNNNVLFSTENLTYPGDKMGPNPHLMSISMIPLPLARFQYVQWSNTNLLLLRALAFCLSSKKLSCRPSLLTEAVCSLNLVAKSLVRYVFPFCFTWFCTFIIRV